MERFCLWIAGKVSGGKRIDDTLLQARCGVIEGWLSAVVNLILFVFKLIAGIMLGSVSLIADAVHTASDCVTSAIVIVVFYLSRKPGDKEHPYGHGRMDLIGALVISVLLFVVSFDLLKDSAAGILQPKEFSAGAGVIVILALSILIKELLARFSISMGRVVKSSALNADGAHHRSDAFTTGVVICALIASRFGFARADGIAGFVVSIVIAWTAYVLMKEAVSPLLGEAPSGKTMETITRIARKRKDVIGVHGVQVHKYGRKKMISFHVEVPDSYSSVALHEMAERLERDTGRELKASVVVHVDPLNTDHPMYESVSNAVDRIVAYDGRAHSFHDLRVEGADTEKYHVKFDVILNESRSEEDAKAIAFDIKAGLKAELPNAAIVVKTEQPYVL